MIFKLLFEEHKHISDRKGTWFARGIKGLLPLVGLGHAGRIDKKHFTPSRRISTSAGFSWLLFIYNYMILSSICGSYSNSIFSVSRRRITESRLFWSKQTKVIKHRQNWQLLFTIRCDFQEIISLVAKYRTNTVLLTEVYRISQAYGVRGCITAWKWPSFSWMFFFQCWLFSDWMVRKLSVFLVANVATVHNRIIDFSSVLFCNSVKRHF